jgi:hypothetical protein
MSRACGVAGCGEMLRAREPGWDCYCFGPFLLSWLEQKAGGAINSRCGCLLVQDTAAAAVLLLYDIRS